MGKIRKDFSGFSVLIPEELEMIVMDKGLTLPPDVPSEVDGFTLIRVIGNINVYSVTNNISNPIRKFSSPIKIFVAYNRDDLIAAHGNHKRLKLAYWDSTIPNWVVISDPDHDYMIHPPTTSMLAEVYITEWAGDPPLAWGT